MGHNSACMGNITEMLAPFAIVLLNDVRQILPRLTLVAMATKFKTQSTYNSATATKFEKKWAITQLVWAISPRCMRLVGVFRDHAIEWRQTNSVTTDAGCHNNEIRVKVGYITRLVYGISRKSLRSTRGFRCRAMMSHKFYHDWPWLPWQRNFRHNRL